MSMISALGWGAALALPVYLIWTMITAPWRARRERERLRMRDEFLTNARRNSLRDAHLRDPQMFPVDWSGLVD